MDKKLMKRVLWLMMFTIIAVVISYIWERLPIITAFASKGMCSSVFLADKNPKDVMAEDLSFFPISLAKTSIDYDEKSATSTVFGLAERKAVFREGLGAVIVLETPAEELLESTFTIPAPEYSQDTIAWPKGDVLPDSLPEDINYEKLNAILDTCFDAPDKEAFKKSLGIAVVYDNQLVAEKYYKDYDFTTKFLGWSMTKTITGAMAGLLSDKGILNPSDPVDVPEWVNDERKNITLENVIQMSSGLEWVENYFTISDATLMLMQSEDMYKMVVGCEAAYEPGSYWNYSSGDANLLSGLIRNTFENDDAYHRFPYEKLFYPIGMLNTVVECDASGLIVASSYSYATVRDWARFGLLFLNQGIFEGDTVLSSEWVKYMQKAAPASDGAYAGTFWLNEPDAVNALTDVPEDVYFADGFQGQRIYIIPSKKLVVVRMGYSLSNFSMNDFLREIISTLPE